MQQTMMKTDKWIMSRIIWEKDKINPQSKNLNKLNAFKIIEDDIPVYSHLKLFEIRKVRKENERYALCTLMSKCLDFAGEQSAMEYLLSSLTEKARDLEFWLLTSPWYHCEQQYWSNSIEAK